MLYGVLGALAAIAVAVIVVSTCLICKEKRRKKKKEEDKRSKLKNYTKPRKGTGTDEKRPRATHPGKLENHTRIERIQPTTDSEMGKSEKVGVQERRAKSAAGQARTRRTTSGGYQPIGDTTEDSEGDTSSIPSTLSNKHSTASLSNSLLSIPFERISRPTSPHSGTSASEDETLKKSLPNPPNSSVQISEKLGSLFISLHYEFQDMSLVLKILRARAVAAKDLGGTSDPYVRIMLLPDKKHKLETKVKHKSLNPVWNETFLFERFPYEKLKSRTIHLEVLDRDRFTSDDPIGEVFLPLVDMNLSERMAKDELELPLKPIDPDRYRLGEILVALSYDGNRELLTLSVIKCRNLKSKDISTGSSDPFVKVWQMRREERVVKHKTAVLRRNLNPVYNESFVYNVSVAQIRETSLHVIVRDHDTVGANSTIGSVLLGAQSGPTEVRQWMEMIGKGKTPVSAWHVLKKDVEG